MWVILLQFAGFAMGLGGLIFEYGFIRVDRTTGLPLSGPPISTALLHAGEYLSIFCFIAAVLSQILLHPSRSDFVKEHITESVLSAGAIFALIAVLFYSDHFSTREIHGLRVGLIAYLVVQILIAFIKFNNALLRSVQHPSRATLVGFGIVILIGGLLLSLPCATYSDRFPDFGNNFVDNLFTSTSAVCVTGLTVRDTGSDYTAFGQFIILMLIQLGGLGIIIFGTIFAMLIGRQVTMQETTLVMDLYNQQAVGQIRKVVKFIILSTLLIEAMGASFLYSMWPSPDSFDKIYMSIFHAVSAFCNAGFGLLPDNLVSMADHWQTYVIIPGLIIIGGLGFPVLLNVSTVFRSRCAKLLRLSKTEEDLDLFRVTRLTLQSKIALLVSFLLIVCGTLAIFLTERSIQQDRWGRSMQYEDIAMKTNTSVMSSHTGWQRMLDAFFLSVSSRTAGFNSVDMSEGNLHPASLVVVITLMVIGGSPASTAGGLKTVTFAILLATIFTTLRHRPNVEIFKRSVDTSLIRRALAISFIYIGMVWLVAMALVITHPQMSYLSLLFEASSACGTVGLSVGVTPHLSLLGRLIVIGGMFAGRLGPLTLLIAMSKSPKKVRYEYPTEDLITG
jgi:trk system potassium uptake protein TrkH